jgi:hypothetical protein
MPETTTSRGKPAPKSAPDRSDDKAKHFPHWWSSPRTTTLLALALAVIAVAVAVAAWFRAGGPSYSDGQRDAAKKSVCSAYQTVYDGVTVNTNSTLNPHLNVAPNDAAGQFRVGVYSRLSLLGDGVYLRDRVAAEPATPDELKHAANALADTLEHLSAVYLTKYNDSVAQPLRHDLDSQMAQLDKLCQRGQ